MSPGPVQCFNCGGILHGTYCPLCNIEWASEPFEASELEAAKQRAARRLARRLAREEQPDA